MSTSIPGEVWRPTSAEQVQVWALSKKLETKGTLLDERTGGRPKMNAGFGSEWHILYFSQHSFRNFSFPEMNMQRYKAEIQTQKKGCNVSDIRLI
jgi:hypothetical protein